MAQRAHSCRNPKRQILLVSLSLWCKWWQCSALFDLQPCDCGQAGTVAASVGDLPFHYFLLLDFRGQGPLQLFCPAFTTAPLTHSYRLWCLNNDILSR